MVFVEADATFPPGAAGDDWLNVACIVGIVEPAADVLVSATHCISVIWLPNRATGSAGRTITLVPLPNVVAGGSCPDVVALAAVRQMFGGNFTPEGIVEIKVGLPRFATNRKLTLAR